MEIVGAAGTLVGATLQSAGYFYQSYVIDYLLTPLAGLPVLIFILGAAAAIASFVLTGRAQALGWFLTGPVLFAAVVSARTRADQAGWRFAAADRDQRQVREEVTAMVENDVYVPRVASLFAYYDRLISSGVQSLVDAFTMLRDDSDITMVARTQLYGFMMSREITDEGLSELLHLSLLGECRKLAAAGTEMADSGLSAGERCQWAHTYKELADSLRFRLTDPAVEYLAAFSVDLPALYDATVTDSIGRELANFKTAVPECSVDAPEPGDAPADAGEEALTAARASQANSSRTSVGGQLPRNTDEIERAVLGLGDRQSMVEQRIAELKDQVFSCHEIWNIAYAALHYEAALVYDFTRQEGKNRGFDERELIDNLEDLTGGSGETGIVSAIARRILRYETAKRPAAQLISEYSERGMQITGIGVAGDADLNQAERSDMFRREWSGKSSLLLTAYSMPYYQGLVLYFLGLLFPFFAFLLLVPGKQMSFTLWFLLWLWAKSWDVGFAVVSLIDDILFSIFVIGTNSPGAGSQSMSPDFSVTLAALREIDPSFEVGTYYNIISVCLICIPAVTSYLIVRGAFTAAKQIEGAFDRINGHVQAKGSPVQPSSSAKLMAAPAQTAAPSGFPAPIGQQAAIQPSVSPTTQTVRVTPPKTAAQPQPAQQARQAAFSPSSFAMQTPTVTSGPSANYTVNYPNAALLLNGDESDQQTAALEQPQSRPQSNSTALARPY